MHKNSDKSRTQRRQRCALKGRHWMGKAQIRRWRNILSLKASGLYVSVKQQPVVVTSPVSAVRVTELKKKRGFFQRLKNVFRKGINR